MSSIRLREVSSVLRSPVSGMRYCRGLPIGRKQGPLLQQEQKEAAHAVASCVRVVPCYSERPHYIL